MNKKIKIIVDSVCALSSELKKQLDAISIPLFVKIGDEPEIIDDGTVDVTDMVNRMALSDKGAVSACPSPETYANEYEAYDEIFVVALSHKLSGSYNSARLGADMAIEKQPNKKIHIFDARCAVSTQTMIAMFLHNKINEGLSFEEIVPLGEGYADTLETLMVMENLSNMIKNGRVAAPTSANSSVLSVCSILKADGNGALMELAKDRGIKKVYDKAIEYVRSTTEDSSPASKTMVLSYCLKEDRVKKLRADILEKCPAIGEVILIPAGAVAGMYMDNGGIIFTY